MSFIEDFTLSLNTPLAWSRDFTGYYSKITSSCEKTKDIDSDQFQVQVLPFINVISTGRNLMAFILGILTF